MAKELKALKLVSSAKYKEAMKKAAEFRSKISGANAFRLDAEVAEANSYFAWLKSAHPEIFDIIRIQRKEISELIIKKRTGLSLVLD